MTDHPEENETPNLTAADQQTHTRGHPRSIWKGRIEGRIGNFFEIFFSAKQSKEMEWELAEKMESRERFLREK